MTATNAILIRAENKPDTKTRESVLVFDADGNVLDAIAIGDYSVRGRLESAGYNYLNGKQVPEFVLTEEDFDWHTRPYTKIDGKRIFLVDSPHAGDEELAQNYVALTRSGEHSPWVPDSSFENLEDLDSCYAAVTPDNLRIYDRHTATVMTVEQMAVRLTAR